MTTIIRLSFAGYSLLHALELVQHTAYYMNTRILSNPASERCFLRGLQEHPLQASVYTGGRSMASFSRGGMRTPLLQWSLTVSPLCVCSRTLAPCPILIGINRFCSCSKRDWGGRLGYLILIGRLRARYRVDDPSSSSSMSCKWELSSCRRRRRNKNTETNMAKIPTTPPIIMSLGECLVFPSVEVLQDKFK